MKTERKSAFSVWLFLACVTYILNIVAGATVLGACANLSIANEAYSLSGPVSINSATCFNITAQNITLDCAGFTITGNKTANTYGVYSNMFNTTLKNGNISNFTH